MCKIVLPIKPEYVERIIAGEKTYEYRKIACKKEIDGIIIYSTSPEQQIVAEVEVVDVLRESPDVIWEQTRNSSGISKEKYFDYFAEAKEAIAYKLGRITRFKEPRALSDYGISCAPQSFVYID